MQELLLADPIEDLMPLNDADRAWIRETIRTAHERHGLGKLLGFIKDWGGTGAAVAILIFALAKWEGYVEFRTSTNIRLDRIDKTLGTISDNLAKQSLVNQAVLPLSDFKATLPDLNSAIVRAKQQNVKVSSAVISDLQGKLRESTDAPSFWPAAAEFINYRSQVIATTDFQPLLRPELPKCADHAPIPMEMEKERDKPGVTIISAYYDNCRLTLDSPEEAKQIFAWFKERAFVVTFRHCHIVWAGGEIKLLTMPEDDNVSQTHAGYLIPKGTAQIWSFSGRYLHFQNCLFAFTLASQPTQEGQEFAQQLLAQNGPSVNFPIQQPATHY